jgi:c-di-GMP-binding flagellar brake protein YcgR
MGGLCFVSRTPFFLNQIVYVDLNEVFQGMVLPAKILRKNRVRDGEYRFKYGCQFQTIMSNQERALCEYAFKMQIINKQKKEGEL